MFISYTYRVAYRARTRSNHNLGLCVRIPSHVSIKIRPARAFDFHLFPRSYKNGSNKNDSFTRYLTTPMYSRTVNLHANQLRSVARTPPLLNLVSLNLSSNHLHSFSLSSSSFSSSSTLRTSPMPSLTHLDLSCNQITALDTTFPYLPSLQILLVPFNRIEDLEGWGQYGSCLLPGG